MRRIQKIARKLFESKVTIHVFFIAFFIILFCAPLVLVGLTWSGIFKGIIFGIFLLSCIYAGRWSGRRWLLANRFSQFTLYAFVLIFILFIIGITGLNLLTNNHNLANKIIIMSFDILFFFFGLSLSITRTTVLRQMKDASILQQQKESELQLLRSQLSPHFLFNTLNNLYGISITQPQKIPGLLLKLSDLLHYSVYCTEQGFVPLTDELTYIDNYIELEKIRMEDRFILEANIQKTNIEFILIAPMLLIVFVENAFKHSKNTLTKKIEIKIDLRIIHDDLLFTIKNTCGDEINETNGIREGSGLGFTNTLKRLELLYPGKYILENHKENGFYQVKLQLKIK